MVERIPGQDPDAGPGKMVDLNEIGAGRTPPAWARYIVENWKLFVGAAGAVVVVVAVLALVDAWRGRQVEDARTEIGQALAKQNGAEKVAALKTVAEKVPSGARQVALVELAKAQSESGDHAGAAETWAKVADGADADLKALAGLGRAAALSASGKAAEAVDVLEKLKGSVPESYGPVIDRQLAASAEKAGQWAKAAAAYAAVKQAGQPQDASYLDQKIFDLKAKANSAGS